MLAAGGIEANLGAQCLSELTPFHGHRSGHGGAVWNSSTLYRQGLALPFCEQYGPDEVDQVVAALTLAVA